MNSTTNTDPDAASTTAMAVATASTNTWVTRVPFCQASTAQLVRPLGAHERVFHRFMEAFPMHFSVVAELAGAVEPEQLRQALVAVQHRHPLLSVHIEDHPDTRLGFYLPAVVPPIPLTVRDTDLSWEQVASEELATAFNPTTAPLLRVVLLRRGPAAATLVLTFDHTIADGKSAVYVLADILAVLNGQPLAVLPVPPSRETLLARQPAPAAGPATPAAADPPAPDWLTAVGTLRPFDGSRPQVASLAFSEALTTRLLQRCRAERTTVQAALIAAASQVLARMEHRQQVRVVSPIDIRALLGVDRDCVMYFNATRTASTAEENQDFWTLARATSAQLTRGRAEAMTRFISALTEQLIPADADHAAAHDLFMSSSFELFISNLGVLNIPETGPLRPTAIYGPIMLTQLQGESTIGVATLHGQLRLVSASHAPIPDFLPLIQNQLAAHVSAPTAASTQGTAATGYLRGLMAQETNY